MYDGEHRFSMSYAQLYPTLFPGESLGTDPQVSKLWSWLKSILPLFTRTIEILNLLLRNTMVVVNKAQIYKIFLKHFNSKDLIIYSPL